MSADEEESLSKDLITLQEETTLNNIYNKIILQDSIVALPLIPSGSVNLAIIDPPYNRSKKYNSGSFSKMDECDYETWLDTWMQQVHRLMRKDGSIYICCDWQCSAVVYRVASRYFTVRNRITWEREKGRGAKSNWKNCSEDIFFCTVSGDYYFDVEAVKLKRRVIAPYRDTDGKPKGWNVVDGIGYRMTHPSNLWTDITVPFWSMAENTDHPTQKPEKLIAKLILASSRPGDVVLDPFGGSGTTAVVSQKLNRQFISIEIDKHYCCLSQKRLVLSSYNVEIQGYADGIFLERNTPAKLRHGLSSSSEWLFL